MALISSISSLRIEIPEFIQEDGVTVYTINVSVGDIKWTVKHRYNEFLELHLKLVSNHGISKELLPPKKIIGNKDPVFLKDRRQSLETYLQNVCDFMHENIPYDLAHFIELEYYELNHILELLANHFYSNGDNILERNEAVTFSPLELYAITHRLCNHVPPHSFHQEHRSDFSHVADFIFQVSSVVIQGSNSHYRYSNFCPNLFGFDLNFFKKINRLILVDVDVTKIGNVGVVRKRLKEIAVHRSSLVKISEVLLCDTVHKDLLELDNNYNWDHLISANFSENNINCIDKSVALGLNIEKLNLRKNNLSTVQHLSKLPNLISLNLSCNSFKQVADLHMKLGNIQELDFSDNEISSLSGFSKLYSLVSLNVSSNSIWEVSEVTHLSKLPYLEFLMLTGNPVAAVIDYRTKVLELLGIRASEVCLDNESTTQQELDKVLVLQAIRAAKQGNMPELNITLNANHTSLLNSLPPDKASAAKE